MCCVAIKKDRFYKIMLDKAFSSKLALIFHIQEFLQKEKI